MSCEALSRDPALESYVPAWTWLRLAWIVTLILPLPLLT